MFANETYLLIGGGYASSRTAECLRQEGFGGRIIILSEEPHLPYSRPPLCKRALKIPTDIGRLPLRHAGFYEKRNIELRLGCEVVRIDRRSEEHTSELQSLMRISYAVFTLNKKKSI